MPEQTIMYYYLNYMVVLTASQLEHDVDATTAKTKGHNKDKLKESNNITATEGYEHNFFGLFDQ